MASKIDEAMAAFSRCIANKGSMGSIGGHLVQNHGELIMACLAVAGDAKMISYEAYRQTTHTKEIACPCCEDGEFETVKNGESFFHPDDCPYAALQALLEANDAE